MKKKKHKNNGKNAWICYTFWVVSLFCTFLLRPDCLVFQPDHLPVVCDNLVSDLCRVLAEKPVWEKEEKLQEDTCLFSKHLAPGA